jgi:hypothetical protein
LGQLQLVQIGGLLLDFLDEIHSFCFGVAQPIRQMVGSRDFVSLQVRKGSFQLLLKLAKQVVHLLSNGICASSTAGSSFAAGGNKIVSRGMEFGSTASLFGSQLGEFLHGLLVEERTVHLKLVSHVFDFDFSK